MVRRDCILRVYDNAAVHSALLLQARVGVVPVGAGLDYWELKNMSCPRHYGRSRQVGNTVLAVGKKNAMPVDRGLHVHSIMDSDNCEIALCKFKPRPGDRTVDRHCLDWFPSKVDLVLLYKQIIFNCSGI